ncbi:MAG: BrnT family toxin [Chloroflexota bacterium]
MFIDRLIWLPQFEDKIIGKHNVFPDEVEEVFLNKPRILFQNKGYVENEDVYVALGQSDSGRYLVVFFVLKSERRALVISARDMNQAERRRYGRK